MDLQEVQLPIEDNVPVEFKILPNAESQLQQQRLLASSKDFSKLITDDTEENLPIFTKTETCIRIKPDGFEQVIFNHPDLSKQVTSINSSPACVEIKCNKQGTKSQYHFPEVVGNLSQTQLYDEMILQRYLDRFLGGYNVNLTAYGNTDSGKTHTLIGPPGIFAQQDTSPEAEELTKVPEDFGLCYRLILSALFKIKQDEQFQGRKIYLTVSAAEVSYADPIDLLTKKVITLDLNSNRYRGLKQVHIESSKDLIDFAKIIEDSSSDESHQLIELLMYERKGNLVHVNCLKVFDLAGSQHFSFDEQQNYEVLTTRASLQVLNNVVQKVTKLPKVLTSGDEIPIATGYKESAISRLYTSSFNGSAFNIVIGCISPQNGSESFLTLEFMQQFSKLRSYVKRPKSFQYQETMDKLEESIKNDQQSLLKLKKYSRGDIESQIFKSRMIDQAQQMVLILARLQR